MDLRTYLFVHRIKVKEFAEKIGYTRSFINGVITGKRKAGKRLIKDIVNATNGEVTFEDFEKKSLTEEKEETNLSK